MHSVLEFDTFTKRAATRLSREELDKVITEIAFSPTRGVLIPGTGGVRKIRVAAGSRGKSGGARVIYYYFDEAHPIQLITVFSKNEKSDLSAKERGDLLKLTERLKAAWRSRSKEADL